MKFCADNPPLAAEGFQRAGKILVRPQPQREGPAHGFRSCGRSGYGSKQLEIGLGIGLRRENCAVDPKSFHGKGFGDHGFFGQDMTAARASVRFRPQRVAMKERRAVALTEGQRGHLESRHADWAKGVAVEGGMFSGPGKGRHDIGKGTERAAGPAQDAAGKSARREAAARGFQQRQAGFQCEGEGAATCFCPLDALGRGRAGLDDLPHR